MTSLVAQMVKCLPTMRKTQVWSLVGKISWRRNENPLQYSCLENPMDGGAWYAIVHGVAKSHRVTSFSFSRLVIIFLPRNKCLLISWLQSPSAVILEHKKTKSLTVFIVSPSVCHEVMGMDAMTLAFWMLIFKLAFSFSSFTFINRVFSSCLLSAIRVVSSAYLRLLIFLLAILIPACASSNPAFRMTYSAYMLNKQGDNIQPLHTPFAVLKQSIFPCLGITVASWLAYRFLRRQVRWSGIPISLRVSLSLFWSTQSKALA